MTKGRPAGDYTQAHFGRPQTVLKEFKCLAHAELVLMFPERFAREVKQFLEA